MAEHKHKHKHKNIKPLCSSYAYAYAYVAIMSSEDVVRISISISERLLANQRPLDAYANHVLTGHNSDISISIRRTLMLMLMSQLSPLAHKLLVLMIVLMLASQVRTGLNINNEIRMETCGDLLLRFCPSTNNSFLRLLKSVLSSCFCISFSWGSEIGRKSVA